MGLSNFNLAPLSREEMTPNNFEQSLVYGHEVERLVLNVLLKKYPKAYMVEGKFKEYDILVPETDTKIEVKADRMSVSTGQFVIEVSMGGKPSGITTTKADYWVMYNGVTLMWIKPEAIMRIILLMGLTQAKFKGGTDKKSKLAYFVPAEKMIEKATLIINL